MIGTKRLFPDFNRLSRKPFPSGVAAAGVFQPAQIVIDGRNIRMIRAEALLGDGQSAPIQRLGFVEAACVFQEHSHIVENCRNFQVIRPEGLFSQRDRLPEKRLRFVVTALLAESIGMGRQ